jgi:hypothetical protein
MAKEDEDLVDLEYYMSKQLREELENPTEQEETELDSTSGESCHYCNRNGFLVAVLDCGEAKWACPKCLKQKIDNDSYPDYSFYGSNDSEGDSTSALGGEPEETSSTEESSETGFSPMSMFD